MINSFSGASGAILESIKRELFPTATVIANQNYPLLGAIMSSMGEAVNSTKIEWQDYQLRARTVVTGAGQLDTSADTTIRLSADASTVVYVGDILMVDGTQELMQVTAVSSTDLTVVRGFGGTANTTIPSGTTLYIVTDGWLEGADYSDRGNFTPSQRFNYSEIFRSDFQISGTMEGITLATGLDGQFNQTGIDLTMHLRKIVDRMAGALVYGAAPASTPQGSASVRRYMNGIVEMIREGSAAGDGAIYADISSADFNQSTNAYKNFVNLMEDLWEAGSTANTIVVNSRIKKQLSTNMENGRESFERTVISRNVEQIDTDFGSFQLMLDNSIRKDGMLALNLGEVSMHPVAGRDLSIEALGKTGDSQKWMIKGEYTLKVTNAATGGQAYWYGAAA
jgi:hypothetical protein